MRKEKLARLLSAFLVISSVCTGSGFTPVLAETGQENAQFTVEEEYEDIFSTAADLQEEEDSGTLAEGMEGFFETESWEDAEEPEEMNEDLDIFQDTSEETGDFLLAEEEEVLTAGTESVALDEAHFPDAKFRQIIADKYDTDGDGILSVEEIGKISWLTLGYNKGISNLKGIEYFTNLTDLDCRDNNLLTELDVSRNEQLTRLDCSGNQLATLDVSKNEQLTSLSCDGNQLSNLDISKNEQLTSLSCSRNQLATLDVSKNEQLTSLSCSGNQLSNLNVSKNEQLTSLDCSSNQLTTLDVSGNPQLQILWCSGNRLTGLDVSGNEQLDRLSCSLNALTTLDVRGAAQLSYLSCSGNALTSLDVSGNTNLKELECGYNLLTKLDVSRNTQLRELDCGNYYAQWGSDPLPSNHNQLTTLDVGKNTQLEWLWCSDNALTTLDVSGNTQLEWLMCTGNQLTTLDISRNEKLKTLECGGNRLTKLNVNRNIQLESLSCAKNQLTELNVSGTPQLKRLYCSNNQLTTLDVTGNPQLQVLSCDENHLTYLNLTDSNGLLSFQGRGQTRTVKVSASSLQVSIADLAGKENLRNVTLEEGRNLAGDGYIILDEHYQMDASGTVTFSHDTLPDILCYSYDTGRGAMEVDIYLESDLVHQYKTVVIKKPTCTEPGASIKVCSSCGRVSMDPEKVIKALGHTGGKATCKKKALCTRCKKRYGKLGAHQFTWKTTKKATVLAPAKQKGTCSVCGKTKTRDYGKKLESVITMNRKSLTLKGIQTSTALKVKKMAGGDYIKSVKSSKPGIVKVSIVDKNKGTLKLISKNEAGTAKVTVTLAGGAKAVVTVKVQSMTTAIRGIKSSLTIKKGKKVTLKPVLEPASSKEPVTYKSSNKNTVSVSAQGVITAKKKGTAVITITSGKVSVKCRVIVK